MAEFREMSEDYFSNLAVKAYEADCVDMGKVGVLSTEDFERIRQERESNGVEKALYLLRRMFGLALARAMKVDSRFHPETSGYSVSMQFSHGDFDTESWHKYCLEVDRSPGLMRERLAKYLKDGQVVADIGSGTGLATLPLMAEYPEMEVVGFDVSEGMLNNFWARSSELGLEERVDGVLLDLESIDSRLYTVFRGCFDQVVSNGTLYYVEDLEGVFAFVSLILKGGGYFHFSLPLRASDPINEIKLSNGKMVNRETYLKHSLLIYFHRREEIMKLAKKFGFGISEEEEYFVHRERENLEDVYFTYFTLKRA